MTEIDETPVEESEALTEIPASDAPPPSAPLLVVAEVVPQGADYQVTAGGLVPGLMVNIVVETGAGLEAVLAVTGDDGSLSMSFTAFTAGPGQAEVRVGGDVAASASFSIEA